MKCWDVDLTSLPNTLRLIALHAVALSEREEIVSTLMYLIKLVKSTVLNVLTYLKVEQYTTKEMKCKGDYLSR